MSSNNDLAEDDPVRILLIDDSEDDFVLTRDLLSELPDTEYRLDWTSDEREALDAICRNEHDIYLIDYRLGAMTGIELIRRTRERDCTAPMILLTGIGERALDFEAMRAGAWDYLEKGKLDATVLERTIRYNLQQKRHEEQLERRVQERTAELAQANAALQAEVAERVRAEAALRDADRRKNLFLATLAHELRNPLVPIRNALEIMRLAGDRPEVIERSRAMVERQVHQLVRLVDDLIDIARISRGIIHLHRERVLLSDAIHLALEGARPFLERAQQNLKIDLPDEALSIEVDLTRFGQILVNLLNNAAKYGRQGGVVNLVIDQEEIVGPWLKIQVIDDGIGIPADMLDRIFEAFIQGQRPHDQTRDGLGVGLSLVRTLVELHGGRIEARSGGPGQGSAFVVRLPVIVPDSPD